MKNALHKIGIISILAFALAACRFSGARAVKERLASSPNPTEETVMVTKIQKTDEEWKAILTPEQYRVLRKAGTERPFTGKYNDHYEEGIYVCAACGTPLFSSKTKYDHGTGWPSFTAPVATENVEFRNDLSHGMFRTEVRCAACGSHLGHVFEDGPPPTRLHFCINSVALDFKPVEARPGSGDATPISPKAEKPPMDVPAAGKELMRGAAVSGGAGCGLPSPGNENPAAPERKERSAIATFAAGCFWGVEDKFRKVQGVISTRVGYTGGTLKNPTYRQVCSDKTGHAEAVEIVFDPAIVSYDTLLELFFRFHDPTQVNRQGPDVGTQYRSAIFYHDESQKEAAEKMIAALNASGKFKRPIATQVVPAAEFYRAEDYHQQYYEKLRRGR